MTTTTICILIAVAAVVIMAILLLTGYNSLVRLNNKVKEAFSTMDVTLKKRYDLIPALVEVVKGYAGHESETLQRVTRMRSDAVLKGNMQQQIDSEVGISAALRGIFVVAEDYPDLKANTNFLQLQEQLARIEDEIARSRRYYNGSVREYNNRCQIFPFNIIAGLFGFKPMPMFAVGSNEERQAVNVNL